MEGSSECGAFQTSVPTGSKQLLSRPGEAKLENIKA